jgi:hypothetical protein
MSSMIGIAPLPAKVKGVLFVEDVCLEPAFVIKDKMPDALMNRPAHMSLTISSSDEYRDDYILYSYKELTLDMQKRSRRFTTGVTIENNRGGVIDPLLNMPAPGKAYRPGSREWQNVMAGNLAKFDKQEADYFLNTIDQAVSHLIDTQ